MDLDIELAGKPLTEIYGQYKNNFALIANKLGKTDHCQIAGQHGTGSRERSTMTIQQKRSLGRR